MKKPVYTCKDSRVLRDGVVVFVEFREAGIWKQKARMDTNRVMGAMYPDKFPGMTEEQREQLRQSLIAGIIGGMKKHHGVSQVGN